MWSSVVIVTSLFFFFKQKTAYEMRISDWSSDVCSSDLLCSSRWFQEAMVANHYGTRRILLVGDAVHKHPPASGLGLNSGIQDVHNLCWKLALVDRKSVV